MFNINFERLINNLLPGFKAKLRQVAWLMSLLKPVMDLYADFLALRDQKLNEARLTGQVDCIEYMLNDAFYGDGTLRHIYLSDNESQTEPVYLYNKGESGPDTYLFNSDETSVDEVIVFQSIEGTGGVDFNVFVPTALEYDPNYMISMINQYKLAGTTYQIISYDE